MRSLPCLAAVSLLLPCHPLAGDGEARLARGEAVMKSFCLSCHGKEGKNPLAPRLKPEEWGDPGKAYVNIGRLSEIQPRMDQPFTRSNEDRLALAAYLAFLAQGNRVPLWRAALPYAALAGGVAVAGLYFLWARRRARVRASELIGAGSALTISADSSTRRREDLG